MTALPEITDALEAPLSDILAQRLLGRTDPSEAASAGPERR